METIQIDYGPSSHNPELLQKLKSEGQPVIVLCDFVIWAKYMNEWYIVKNKNLLEELVIRAILPSDKTFIRLLLQDGII